MQITDKIIGSFTNNQGYKFSVVNSETNNGLRNDQTTKLWIKPPEDKVDALIAYMQATSPEYTDQHKSEILQKGYSLELGGTRHSDILPATTQDRQIANDLWSQVWKRLDTSKIPVCTAAKSRIKELASIAVQQMSLGLSA